MTTAGGVNPMRVLRKFLAVIIIMATLASAAYITSEAGSIAYGAATVAATSLNVRSGPDTTYSLVSTINHGERMVVLEKTSNDWYHINYHGIDGYVASLYLTNVLTAENFTATGKISGSDVTMRSTPSTAGTKVAMYNAGTIVNIIGINSGWYKVKINGTTGYIRSDFIAITADGTTTVATTIASSTTQTASATVTQTAAAALTLRQQLVDYALQFVGSNYVYGGSSPSSGFDCSGLVYCVFRHFDYDLTRTASSQYAHDGVSITKSELQPGDLVFFSSNNGYSITHVGIYIGNNQFVHASSPKVGVVISSLDSAYYTNVWYGAKRVLS